ncbi:MAG: hypothetical protein KF869_12305 [Phycisphaeraceae bacterium]|nr:hypothetical protein [Phycisphaeraceae bacterium]
MLSATRGLIVVAALSAAAWSGTRALGQCDREWIPWQGVPGVDGRVYAMCSHGPAGSESLFVGGRFTVAGDQAAAGVARWDGERWHAVGGSLTIELGTPNVSSMAVFQDQVVIAGQFDFADGLPVSHIARWNGTSWQPFGAGLPRRAAEVAVYGGDLYATMSGATIYDPPGPGIVRWNGATWEDVAPPGTLDPDGVIAATGMTVHDGRLYVAYRAQDELQFTRIASWDGQSWTGPGVAPDINVLHLASHAGALYCGGTRTTPSVHVNVRRWTGSEWATLPIGLLPGNRHCPVYALCSMGGQLWIAGDFSLITTGWLFDLLMWNGSQLAVYPPVNRDIYSLTAHRGLLHAGGSFDASGSTALGAVAVYDNGWQALGAGTNGTVQKIKRIAGDLFCTGSFESIMGTPIAGIATWDGRRWHGFGTGLAGVTTDATMYDGSLVAVGYRLHPSAPGSPRANVGRFNGTSWVAMGGGVGTASSYVWQVEHFENDLVVCGRFTQLPGVGPATNIARWNGLQWSPLVAQNGPVVVNGDVMTMVRYGSDLIFAGAFTQPSRLVGRFDGATWHPMGMSGRGGWMFALCVHEGDLYVAGDFWEEDDEERQLHGVARWNGTDWESVGGGLGRTPWVYTMASTIDGLIVTGENLRINGELIGRMARWDGQQWSDFGVGNIRIETILPEPGGMLVGGDFGVIGGVVSAKLAEYRAPLDIDRDGAFSVSDLFAYMALWFDADARADWNRSGEVDINDLFEFFAVWLAGCP